MSLDTIRLSQPARDQLVWLKRTTGIKNWNVLCRWALAMSLRDPSTPLVKKINTDSNVEMDWATFAGTYADVYLALLKQRCAADGEPLTDKSISRTLTIHLHRGIGHLAGNQDIQTIRQLVTTASE
ncbi:DNA sulfur modification protein DndE [Streptomyces sp. NEAU-YJ-81]|uniref:DNA sulfur modification protein DndE n=1 Tax=Streptomyces sp. NEAU-YJ-81 TaxID=2820288 RepID=UPI001ABD2227|nr:DNA sulfur modification protein DndE [Streptomyces sp. NEAU-YJ-81]MBO3673984.1 DNA sulfur modification protein DndE [Streptomyces sp. NEAU-YJ-81]